MQRSLIAAASALKTDFIYVSPYSNIEQEKFKRIPFPSHPQRKPNKIAGFYKLPEMLLTDLQREFALIWFYKSCQFFAK